MSANLLRAQAHADENGVQIDIETKTEEKVTPSVSHIKIIAHEGNYYQDEVVMLEFQGDFEHSESGQFDNLDLGTLVEPSKGNFELKIGNHLVKGKIQDLAKPMVMTEKIINQVGEMEFIVKAVIKKKIAFAGRPTPLRKTNDTIVQNNTKQRKLN